MTVSIDLITVHYPIGVEYMLNTLQSVLITLIHDFRKVMEVSPGNVWCAFSLDCFASISVVTRGNLEGGFQNKLSCLYDHHTRTAFDLSMTTDQPCESSVTVAQYEED